MKTWLGKILVQAFSVLGGYTGSVARFFPYRVKVVLIRGARVVAERVPRTIYFIVLAAALSFVKRVSSEISKPFVFSKNVLGLFVMNLDVRGLVQRHIYVMREYEPWVTQYIKGKLSRGGHFVDIGANVGYFSLLASSLVGPEGTVISFEPEPRNVSLLKRNIEVNARSNIEVCQEAVGASAGSAQLHFNERNEGGHSVYGDSTPEDIEVSVVTIDEFLGGRDVDVVKIDVEGYELEVLRGMKEILESEEPFIVCEVSRDYQKIADMMFDLGYGIFRFGRKGALIGIDKDAFARKDNYVFEKHSVS